MVQFLDVAHSGVDDEEGALICHALASCSSWLRVSFAGTSLIWRLIMLPTITSSIIEPNSHCWCSLCMLLHQFEFEYLALDAYTLQLPKPSTGLTASSKYSRVGASTACGVLHSVRPLFRIRATPCMQGTECALALRWCSQSCYDPSSSSTSTASPPQCTSIPNPSLLLQQLQRTPATLAAPQHPAPAVERSLVPLQLPAHCKSGRMCCMLQFLRCLPVRWYSPATPWAWRARGASPPSLLHPVKHAVASYRNLQQLYSSDIPLSIVPVRTIVANMSFLGCNCGLAHQVSGAPGTCCC